jgi:hypothetical protein
MHFIFYRFQKAQKYGKKLLKVSMVVATFHDVEECLMKSM